MPAFGENLRREREMRGVSLEEISAATKISLRLLEAIEREDFAKLPGGIFSRSFLRSYARYLGLDEDRVVAEFQLAARPQTEFDLHRMPAGSANAGRRPTRKPLVATLLAMLLLAGGYALFRYSARTSEAQSPLPPPPVVTAKPPVPDSNSPGSDSAGPATMNPTAPDSAGTGVTPGAVPATPPASANPPMAGSPPALGRSPTTAPATAPDAPTAGNRTATGATLNPPAGASAAPKPAIAGDLVLQIAATDRAWVAVDADGKTVLQRVLNANELVTLDAHKSFDITTGNAQAVILTLNGQTQQPLGRRGEVKTVHLSREDLKNSTP